MRTRATCIAPGGPAGPVATELRSRSSCPSSRRRRVTSRAVSDTPSSSSRQVCGRRGRRCSTRAAADAARSGEPSLGSIDQDHNAVAHCAGLDELQTLLFARLVEQALAAAEYDREDHEVELVDEVV